MAISDSHASHITKVGVSFVLRHPDLDPEQVTEALGTEPTRSGRRGDPHENPIGVSRAPWREGFWRLGSQHITQSKDINDHFNAILPLLLPHRAAISAFAQGGGETFFDVVWCSTYLYAGTGPLINATCLQGVADLGAGMGFDIYQVEEASTKVTAQGA